MNLLKIRKPKRYYIEDYMQDLRDEMNSFLKNTFESMGVIESETGQREIIHRPPVHLCEKNGNYQVKIQLPGIKKEDINVEVSEDSVMIKTEIKHEKQEEQGNVYRSEFRYGRFMREIPLPSEVDNTKANAEYKDGVLEITIPKAKEEECKSKKLTVQ
jgi:HSP20 family protein